MYWEAIFKALAAGLSIWEHKEKNKYKKKVLDLKQEYYEEYNKPDSERDDAVLDNIRFELHSIVEIFSSEIGKENPKD